MSLWHALILGLVQGATEFLPVSSTAHLILVPQLLGWPDQGLSFDLACHLGTFLAVAIYFRDELAAIARGLVPALRHPAAPESRLLWALGLGSVPVAAVGFLARGWAESAARNALLIAGASIVFGLLLGLCDRLGAERRGLESVDLRDGGWIGAAQALAVIPGASRSGVTMSAGLLRGLDRAAATRFSFLLAIPASLLIAVKHVWDLAAGRVPVAELPAMAIGLVTSALAGYAVIGWLLGWVRRHSLMGFAVYRVLLGLAILAVWAAHAWP